MRKMDVQASYGHAWMLMALIKIIGTTNTNDINDIFSEVPEEVSSSIEYHYAQLGMVLNIRPPA